MERSECSLCGGMRVTFSSDGVATPCSCHIKDLVKQELSRFIPAPPPTQKVRDVLISLEGSGDQSVLISALPGKQHRTLLLMYLTRVLFSKKSFIVADDGELIDWYFSDSDKLTLREVRKDIVVIMSGLTAITHKWATKLPLEAARVWGSSSKVIFYDHQSDGEVAAALNALGFKKI